MAMWFTTFVMFAGSTVHYSLNWAQMLKDNATQQKIIDYDWDLFCGNSTDWWLLYNSNSQFPVLLQYLPIINVSLYHPVGERRRDLIQGLVVVFIERCDSILESVDTMGP